MVTEDDKLLVERALNGDLDPAAADNLRRRLEREADLRDYHERIEQQQTFLATEAKVTATLEYLRKLPDGTNEKPSGVAAGAARQAATRARRLKWLLLAAALLMLLLALWYLNAPPPATPIIDHRPVAVNMADAPPDYVRAYNAGDYATALPGLRTALEQADDPGLRLALIVSLIETDKPAAALPELDRLAEAPLYADAVAFYRAYAAYRAGDSAAARRLLAAVPRQGFYGLAADRLATALAE